MAAAGCSRASTWPVSEKASGSDSGPVASSSRRSSSTLGTRERPWSERVARRVDQVAGLAVGGGEGFALAGLLGVVGAAGQPVGAGLGAFDQGLDGGAVVGSVARAFQPEADGLLDAGDLLRGLFFADSLEAPGQLLAPALAADAGLLGHGLGEAAAYVAIERADGMQEELLQEPGIDRRPDEAEAQLQHLAGGAEAGVVAEAAARGADAGEGVVDDDAVAFGDDQGVGVGGEGVGQVLGDGLGADVSGGGSQEDEGAVVGEGCFVWCAGLVLGQGGRRVLWALPRSVFASALGIC